MAICPPNLFQSPRVAGTRIAVIYLLIVVAYASTPLLMMMSNWSGDRFAHLLRIIVPYVICFSLLAWGCLHLNKFAYWISLVMLSLDSFLFLRRFPDELKFIFNTVRNVSSMNETIDFQSAFPPVAFYYMAFIVGVLKTIALGLLLIRPTRCAFGIGKASLS